MRIRIRNPASNSSNQGSRIYWSYNMIFLTVRYPKTHVLQFSYHKHILIAATSLRATPTSQTWGWSCTPWSRGCPGRSVHNLFAFKLSVVDLFILFFWLTVRRPTPVLRIRIHRIHMFLGLPDLDPLVRGMDPDPSVIMQNSKKNLDSYYFVTLFDFLSFKNDVNVPSKSNKQKKLC